MAAFWRVAMFSLAYLLGQPVAIGMVMAGLGFAPALWWGPGSGRLREMTRGLVTRTARSEFGGWFVVAMCVLGTAVLLGLLLSDGPNWAPALDRSLVLTEVRQIVSLARTANRWSRAQNRTYTTISRTRAN